MHGMNKTAKGILLQLACLLAAVAIAVGLQARERAYANLYTYALADSDTVAACGYDYVALDEHGTLPMSVARPGAARDDRAALVPLERPFEFYQSPLDALVVSDNGYLASAGSLEREDGTDFSNDCGLPVKADNAAASQDRVYVYHDDLRPQAGGSVRQAFFETCPRVPGSGRSEACTVVEWNRFERTGPLPSARPLVAQAVLYHGSHEIALQYASVDDSQGAQATIGLQGFDGRAARQAGCDTPRQVRARQALCFFDPRKPPSAGRLAVAGPR